MKDRFEMLRYGRCLLLGLLLWLSASVGWAQPSPDEAYLLVTFTTPSGNPVPFTAQTSAALLCDDPTRARAGVSAPDLIGQRFLFTGLKAGEYILVVNDAARHAQVEQHVTLREGMNEIAARLPLAQLDVQFTLDGAPVTPRRVVAYFKPPRSAANDPMLPVSLMPGAATRLDGLPTEEAQLLFLTDAGTALTKVTASLAPNGPPAIVPLTPGGMADITATEVTGAVLTDVPIIYTVPGLGAFPLTTDGAGVIRGFHLPVGRASLQIPWTWLANHRDYRSTWCGLLVKAGEPATLAFSISKRQSVINALTVENAAVIPEQVVFLLYQPSATPLFVEQPTSWQKNCLVVQFFFPIKNRAWLFTNRGYAMLDFSLPIEQLTLEQTVSLTSDGGVIDLTVQTTPDTPTGVYRYLVRGKLSGLNGADVPVTINLTLIGENHYRSPQLPAGDWSVDILGQKVAHQAVEVKPGATTTVTLAL